MITRTYISKFSTIIKDSEKNVGINPVAELLYGSSVTRLLVYFDTDKVKKLIDDKTFADKSKLKHYLRITNVGSIDSSKLHCGDLSSIDENLKVRTSSFTLIYFLIPKKWDGGKGFDYTETFFNQGYYGVGCNSINYDSSRCLTEDGCNWYQAQNGENWDEEGIFTNETLSKEYDKWSACDKTSKVIGRQHFDIGNENINIDITEIFNKFIDGELENYGIGIAYSPLLESTEDTKENYVGFMTHKTNTFFEPYVETVYDDYINDDRSNFALDKENKLYLYCNIGNKLENLDEIPTCNVNGVEYEVFQATRGVYYIEILLSSSTNKPNTMYYDTWGNIKYNGVELNDVELDFVTKSEHIYFNIGDSLEDNIRLTPTLSGIKSDEKIKRGDLRKIIFTNKVNYEKNKQSLVDDMEWRLYIKDGTREVDVFEYQNVNKSFVENYALIDTSILIPNKYYIDVKYKYNMEVIENHNALSFYITDDLNNKYA